MYIYVCVHMCIHMYIGRVLLQEQFRVSNYYALSVTVLLKWYIMQLHSNFTLYSRFRPLNVVDC